MLNNDLLTRDNTDKHQSFSASYGLFDVPQKDEVRCQLLAIANEELIDCPAPLIDLLR